MDELDLRRPIREAKTHRPHLIVFDQCTRVLVRNVTMIDSPMFHFIPRRCRDVRIEGITIRAGRLAEHRWRRSVGMEHLHRPLHDRLRRRQHRLQTRLPGTEWRTRGRKRAGGGLHDRPRHRHRRRRPDKRRSCNVTIRNCKFTDTRVGIRLKASVGHGGVCEDIVFENLAMTNVHDAIVFTSHYQQPLFTPTHGAGGRAIDGVHSGVAKHHREKCEERRDRQEPAESGDYASRRLRT